MNYDAVSAYGTAAAALFSVAAIFVAVLAPRWQRRRDTSEGTSEVLLAAREAIAIFKATEARVPNVLWRDVEVGKLCAKAVAQKTALERLISRPELTDGSIVTGAAAMSLLEGVECVWEVCFSGSGLDLNSRAQEEIDYARAMVDLIQDRAKRVAKYAIRQGWPRARHRFQTISDMGL